ncbi:MAG: hypothetical protein V2I33_12400 [Kangiellaceae bacterium]|jgi:hypothetical protein|nr:hypothetical protein [Kangiellaceae bacterium]
MNQFNQQPNLLMVTDEQVEAFIQNRHPQIYREGGCIEYQKAKVKIWLFYNQNQSMFHELISECREDILSNILNGKTLAEAFQLEAQ